jgi:hypothetical protein
VGPTCRLVRERGKGEVARRDCLGRRGRIGPQAPAGRAGPGGKKEK